MNDHIAIALIAFILLMLFVADDSGLFDIEKRWVREQLRDLGWVLAILTLNWIEPARVWRERRSVKRAKRRAFISRAGFAPGWKNFGCR